MQQILAPDLTCPEYDSTVQEFFSAMPHCSQEYAAPLCSDSRKSSLIALNDQKFEEQTVTVLTGFDPVWWNGSKWKWICCLAEEAQIAYNPRVMTQPI